MQSTRNDNDTHPITTVLPTTLDVTYSSRTTTATSSNVKITTPPKASETKAGTTTKATAATTKAIVVNPTTTSGNEFEHVTLSFAQEENYIVLNGHLSLNYTL